MTHPTELIDQNTLSLNHCPKCGGIADNGHDRCFPPSAYYCTKCMAGQHNPEMVDKIKSAADAHAAGKYTSGEFEEYINNLTSPIIHPASASENIIALAEEWQACCAMLFNQMTDLVESARKQESRDHMLITEISAIALMEHELGDTPSGIKSIYELLENAGWLGKRHSQIEVDSPND